MTKNNKEKFSRGKIVIYKDQRGPEIKVKLENNTIWLDAHLMARLFGIDRTVIVKHIKNIYQAGELKEKSTCAKIAQVAADSKMRKMNLYNLDMIISVGYRVNSKKATHFRIWATKILKQYLLQGYAINEKRLLETRSKFKELQQAISFLQEKTKHQLLFGQEKEILDLLANYSKTLKLLEQYDQGKLRLSKRGKTKFILKYEDVKEIIKKIKEDLIAKKEASDLFGQENDKKLSAVLGNIYQTFAGQKLYSSIEEKSAYLLYFIIKDHPFVDGNKRIASFLFIYFLDKNNFLYRKTGERKINDNALTALALLIAVSDPRDKEVLIKIITNLVRK
ncbi:MAG TPA: Fic/DOC family protein [Candidatus Portnoybacteria bacterium]|nr:Fic/DOC family protein [Candidatus Portnoybacteria bacterium]